jgi:hypothetical protein
MDAMDFSFPKMVSYVSNDGPFILISNVFSIIFAKVWRCDVLVLDFHKGVHFE